MLQLFELVQWAASERRQGGPSSAGSGGSDSEALALPFQYAVVLTKADRATAKQLAATKAHVRRALTDITQNIQQQQHDRQFTRVRNPDDQNQLSAIEDIGSAASLSNSPPVLDAAEILVTSSKSKLGSDDMWRLLQRAISRH